MTEILQLTPASESCYAYYRCGDATKCVQVIAWALVLIPPAKGSERSTGRKTVKGMVFSNSGELALVDDTANDEQFLRYINVCKVDIQRVLDEYKAQLEGQGQ